MAVKKSNSSSFSVENEVKLKGCPFMSVGLFTGRVTCCPGACELWSKKFNCCVFKILELLV